MPKFKMISKGKVVARGKRLRKKVSKNTLSLKMLKNSSQGVQETLVLPFGTALPFSSAAFSLDLISGISTGDDDDTREGNAVHINKIHIKGYVQKTANNSGAGWVRVMLVRAVSANGVAPKTTDLLQTDKPYDFILDQLTLYGKGKRPLDVVWDREIILASDDKEIVKFEKVYRPPKSEITTYKGATSAIEHTLSNHYFLFMMQNRTATSDVSGYLTSNVFFQP